MIFNRYYKNLKPLKCKSDLRSVSQYHTYDYYDTFVQTNQAFQKQNCNGHGWYQSKFMGGCGDTCGCTQFLLEKVFGSQLFNTGEITAWHSTSMTSSRAVKQWEESKGGHREAMLNRSHDYIGCYMYQNYGSCLFA